MKKKFVTSYKNISNVYYEPSDGEYIIDAEKEIYRFYFNYQGKIGDITIPIHTDLASTTGLVYVFFTDKEVPDGSDRIQNGNVLLENVINNPNWALLGTYKFGKYFDPVSGYTEDTVYYIDVDVSRLAGNFQIFCIFKK